MDNTKEYKVFISYSWTTPEHEKWVYDLASRLTENGIEVKFDKWNLSPGHDKYVFMESMVQDPSINRVLIICDKGYKEKADKRKDGVGTETQIITPELYNKASQDKFIPIIAEKGEKIDSYLPIYLKGRIAINMSSDDIYENGYEQLLRSITERPLFRKPTKGQLPSFLFEDEKSHFKTANLVKQLNSFIISRPQLVGSTVSDFISEFLDTLNQFKINVSNFSEPYDESICNYINDLEPLRNDYVLFLSTLCKTNYNLDIDIIINLFEELYLFTESQESSYNKLQFDHYKFFITELFLYTSIVFIENGLFDKLNLLLSSKYFVKSRHDNIKEIDFTEFRFYIHSLDEYRKSRLNQNRISITADLLVQRSIINNKNYKEKLLDADILLHYISVIKFNTNDFDVWFPSTYIYREYIQDFILLRRIISERHFEKVKILFNVKTKDEMKSLLENYKTPYRGYNSAIHGIPSIINYIKPENVCTSP